MALHGAGFAAPQCAFRATWHCVCGAARHARAVLHFNVCVVPHRTLFTALRTLRCSAVCCALHCATLVALHCFVRAVQHCTAHVALVYTVCIVPHSTCAVPLCTVCAVLCRSKLCCAAHCTVRLHCATLFACCAPLRGTEPRASLLCAVPAVQHYTAHAVLHGTRRDALHCTRVPCCTALCMLCVTTRCVLC